MSRDLILGRVRTALGRSAGQAPPPPPEARIVVPEVPMEVRIERFCTALGKLNGKWHVAASMADARDYAERLLAGRRGIASNAPILAECGIATLAGVESGFADKLALRERCIHYDVGITSATYALAETGTLVMFASHEEARLVSLLPPVHLAVVPRARLLTGLDELLSIEPRPAERTSSMVFITGPSRTADIEQFLVRGVHGPGEIHVVLV
jgi:L-lactate dehydrogenase complex protein LldG